MNTVIINISDKRKEYPIFIGKNLLPELSSFIEGKHYSQLVVITDANIQKLWLPSVLESLSLKPHVIILPAGEKSKTIHSVEIIWKELHAVSCDRKSLVINLGGGVIGDLGGFAASTYMRGIDFIQIPTSLLSAVDASVGGKTGIDFADVKNLIGTFQQPVAVMIDIEVMKTLPQREFLSGFAEVIKHGLIQDASYFDKVTAKKPIDFSDDELIDIIQRSCEIKKDIVIKDEKEAGLRKIVNFGHTIGHAIESLSWETDTPLLHGEAVAIGMIVETEISKRMGLISQEELQMVKHKIRDAGFQTKVKGITLHHIMEKIMTDKKNISGKVLWVLLQQIGKAIYDQEVEQGIVVQSIENVLS